ncbi:RHS repeat-associated core domain-containing protein [Niabella sp.]|uniref:RHS repeat-associated core domain-containing protein n=1 Tax=Niabella sp. TaxID=1962976 RepID=UPI00262BFE21|nr:RHS repeat-associated core domain-containing protein [Niabella sp.]
MVNEDKTLLEETHYYPFGLAMRGISTQNATASLRNKDKTFQGQKFDDDLGLNYYSFKYRNHDPQIGRFIQIDPIAGDYPHNSTYAFSENRVINGVELEGLEYMTYGYNLAGVRANQQATAQRSTQRSRSGAMRTFDKGIKLAGGLALTTKTLRDWLLEGYCLWGLQ